MSKLLNNLPIEDLTKENDYLGIIDKGEIIKTFLESNTDEFKDIKMFSLYGEWGSGKSTLMKYLKKELKVTFNTFFFEAWQFEKDDNLSVSFLEYLLEKSNTVEEEFAGDLLKFGGKLLRGLGNSVQFNVPLYPEGPSIKVNPSKFIDEFAKTENVTFYKALEEFKVDFRKWEDLNNGRKDKDYNIIFIDDLDRCEPENVLNLLSALKLFFTYGEKTIFFCGIDKKAIKEAVKTKYGKVVKANEYLEKIFDISFSMPKHKELFKLVSRYFQDERLKGINNSLEKEISDFFYSIHFTNPRRVKKVLNKYLIIKNLKEQSEINSGSTITIPSIITASGGNYLETIILLYLIIINEFYPSILESSFNLDLKLKIFEKAVEHNARLSNSNNIQSHVASILNHTKTQFSYIIKKIVNDKISLYDIMHNDYAVTPQNERGQNYLKNIFFISILFCPTNIQSMSANSLLNNEMFKSTLRVENTLIDYYFIEYLLNLFSEVDDYKNLSSIPIIEFKNIIKTLS